MMTFDLSLIEVIRMDLSAAELLVIEAEENDRISRWVTGKPMRHPFPLIGRFLCLCRGAHAWSPRKDALFVMGHNVFCRPTRGGVD